MKITTFNPMIVSPKADDVVSVFEALGFQKTHAPVTALETRDVPSVRMKHPDGYHVDVADVGNLPRDLSYIRMNVDDFKAAYDILIAHGFTNTRGDGTLDTTSAKEATMVSPSGITISLVQHEKKCKHT